MSQATNSTSSRGDNAKELKMRKKKIRIETLKATAQWSLYSIVLPLIPVGIVWGISCFLTSIIAWEPFKLFEDFVLITSGICISALGVLDSKLEVGTRREHKTMESISRFMYVALLMIYIVVYGRGLSNPTLALIISKQENTITFLFIITVAVVLIQAVIVYFIEYKARMEEGENHEI